MPARLAAEGGQSFCSRLLAALLSGCRPCHHHRGGVAGPCTALPQHRPRLQLLVAALHAAQAMRVRRGAARGAAAAVWAALLSGSLEKHAADALPQRVASVLLVKVTQNSLAVKGSPSSWTLLSWLVRRRGGRCVC